MIDQISVTLKASDGKVHQLSGAPGQSIKDLAKDGGVEGIQALCGGEASCGTCQIAVDEEWRDCLPPIGEEEQDMLDFVANKEFEGVRLSCQLILTPAMDGLKATVAEE